MFSLESEVKKGVFPLDLPHLDRYMEPGVNGAYRPDWDDDGEPRPRRLFPPLEAFGVTSMTRKEREETERWWLAAKAEQEAKGVPYDVKANLIAYCEKVWHAFEMKI